MRTALSEQMHALADTGHPRASELRELADKFDVATAKNYSKDRVKDDAKRMLGAWARAHRVHCECTGRPLLS